MSADATKTTLTRNGRTVTFERGTPPGMVTMTTVDGRRESMTAVRAGALIQAMVADGWTATGATFPASRPIGLMMSDDAAMDPEKALAGQKETT